METSWTHPSVAALGAADPVETITERARELVLKAMDEGWSGPPYDPLRLADIAKIAVRPTDEVRDAQTVSRPDGGLRIDFNPTRPRARVRFSIAHELGHALFADCAERVRKRAAYHELAGDDWQLETLCNVAAAEIIMPVGSLPEADIGALSIEHLLDLRRRYEVSMEALLNRLVRVSDKPLAMFCASRVLGEEADERYRVEYAIGSHRWSAEKLRGQVLPSDSVVARCTAIGMTGSEKERWPSISEDVGVRCVAVQPHPGSVYPRVVGLLIAQDEQELFPMVEEVPGNALRPQRTGPAIIAHVVNNKTPNWGGRGFAQALRSEYPGVQEDFKQWVGAQRSNLQLGNVRWVRVEDRVTVATMVAQAGYGESAKPRLRYRALEACLEEVAEVARTTGAVVHMPRIGTGAGGGDWRVIQGIIDDALCRTGVRVIVYFLPSKEDPWRGVARTGGG